jgi:hypothetical protein
LDQVLVSTWQGKEEIEFITEEVEKSAELRTCLEKYAGQLKELEDAAIGRREMLASACQFKK